MQKSTFAENAYECVVQWFSFRIQSYGSWVPIEKLNLQTSVINVADTLCCLQILFCIGNEDLIISKPKDIDMGTVVRVSSCHFLKASLHIYIKKNMQNRVPHTRHLELVVVFYHHKHRCEGNLCLLFVVWFFCISSLYQAAYDRVLNAKKAAKLRHRELDSKRQKLKEELEARERQAEESARQYRNFTSKTDEEKLQVTGELSSAAASWQAKWTHTICKWGITRKNPHKTRTNV